MENLLSMFIFLSNASNYRNMFAKLPFVPETLSKVKLNLKQTAAVRIIEEKTRKQENTRIINLMKNFHV